MSEETKHVSNAILEELSNNLTDRDVNMVSLNGRLELYSCSKINPIRGARGNKQTSQIDRASGIANRTIKSEVVKHEGSKPGIPSFEEYEKHISESTPPSSPLTNIDLHKGVFGSPGGMIPGQFTQMPSLSIPGQGMLPGRFRSASLTSGAGSPYVHGGGRGSSAVSSSSAYQRSAQGGKQRSHSLGEYSKPNSIKLLADMNFILNESHPDYDFSSCKAHNYKAEIMSHVVLTVNQSLAELNNESQGFLVNMWSKVDEVLLLQKCEVFSYLPDMEDDPFSDDALWSFNYFFYNPEKKQICYFTCVCKRRQASDDENDETSVTNREEDDDYYSLTDGETGNSPTPGGGGL